MWCMNLQGRRPGRKSFTYLCDPEPYSLLLPPPGDFNSLELITGNISVTDVTDYSE